MKKILITPRLQQNVEYPEVREALDIKWGKFLSTCDLMPISTSIGIEPSQYFEVFDIEGVLLTGGNDLSRFAANDPLSIQRDEYEKKLLKLAQLNKVPVLGICRGMQVICEYSGIPLVPITGHISKEHEVSFRKNTLLSQFYNPQMRTNSFHCYGIIEEKISALPGEWRIAATAFDGSVEAVENPKLRWVGLMWHPERQEPFQIQDTQFIRSFFEGAPQP
ncbi:MAG: gamma-glutamyl-gamma-aminobutyrate hydrolase family protein [Pseudobdellovibrionaceae bacterium]